MGDDFVARDRHLPRFPEIPAVALADLKVGKNRLVGHRPPADCEIRGRKVGFAPQVIVLPGKHASFYREILHATYIVSRVGKSTIRRGNRGGRGTQEEPGACQQEGNDNDGISQQLKTPNDEQHPHYHDRVANFRALVHARGLIGQAKHSFCDDVALHLVAATSDGARFAGKPGPCGCGLLGAEVVPFPADSASTHDGDL